MDLGLLAYFQRQDGMRLREIALCMDCSITWAHHASRVAEGYLRKLSRQDYLIYALTAVGETDA